MHVACIFGSCRVCASKDRRSRAEDEGFVGFSGPFRSLRYMTFVKSADKLLAM